MIKKLGFVIFLIFTVSNLSIKKSLAHKIHKRLHKKKERKLFLSGLFDKRGELEESYMNKKGVN